ncbi:FlgB family protein [Pseudoroseicyclus tamaricis]|uniref:FlgB family protein n=1 Tax=Pseudoroseicyclus tamaricis TaxID=2705421 RepID=A0A6B2JNE1_9RHOB|nr:FlgB family protein [Pseudoroseicyclus tamaricis]NDU99499.1 FlgB family protein [Pseudoroseicyclus tamaricis]
MFDNLAIFGMADAMARHAGARTALVARNLANADTPGYRASHLPSFAEVADSGGVEVPSLRTTRAGHIGGDPAPLRARQEPAEGQTSPNGNSVSIEEEMVRAVAAEREHSRALAVYRHSMQVLRTVIGT